MATDDERREVAERLRELDYSDLQESLICAYLDALGINGYEDWIGIAHRLADLIDPDCEEGRYEGVHTARPVDREALLALADEMDEVAQRRRSMGYEGFAIGDEDRARRIREALGVES